MKKAPALGTFEPPPTGRRCSAVTLSSASAPKFPNGSLNLTYVQRCKDIGRR
jgi:hypothetical protein